MTCPLAILVVGYKREYGLKAVVGAVMDSGMPIYLSLDGARDEDSELCIRTQALAKRYGERHRHITYWQQDENRGLARHITSSITRVLEMHDQIIVLEDDCVPHSGLIEYFRKMLEYYRDDNRVFSIAGSAFLEVDELREVDKDQDYFFSRFVHVWGWATWKDRWSSYDIECRDLEGFVSRHDDLGISCNPIEIEFWRQTLSSYMRMEEPTSWDFQWSYAHFKNSGLCAVPVTSYIRNIGDTLSTHVSLVPRQNQTSVKPPDIIRHCKFVVANSYLDRRVFLKTYRGEEMEKKNWIGKARIKRFLRKATERILKRTSR